jgi:hypothetical protein
MGPIAQYTYLAEIKLVNAPANGQKVPFLDIPQLRNVKTIGIECFKLTDLTISPNSNTVVSVLTGMVLTLAIQSAEDIYLYPCNDLNPALNSGLIRPFAEKKIDFPKSYITILDSTGLSQNESVLFNIIYRK